jgi:hypothetical protein
MTGELVPAGQTVRVIPSEIGPVIPVVDIAESIGYSRGSITNAITKNEAAFRGYTSFQALQTPGGNQQFLCLNQTGIERLILLIRPAKKKGDLCERVETFRVKAFGRMEQKKEIAQTPIIDEELVRARHLAEQTGGNLAAFQKIALEKCGYGDYAPALQVPALVHGEPGWFNVTQLVAMCNDPLLNPERLNWYLANNPKDPERRPFQYRDENHLWRLTPLGMEHGKEYWYTAPSQHQEIRIAWRESVLYASGLKRPISSDQTALARAA